MTEKELKRLSRVELLELMLEQGKEIEELKAIIARQEEELNDRRIRVEKAGNIADASFALNGVFEAAQEAAKQYLDSIKDLSSRQEKICMDKVASVDKSCEILRRITREECDKMKEEAERYCRDLKAKAEKEAE